MPNSDSEQHVVHLFVGFGGSGLKTLAALSQMISADGVVKSQMPRRSAFLLVDTDMGDLQTFGDQIRRQLAVHRSPADNPIIKRLALAEGVDSMDRFVASEIKVDSRTAEELELLHRHWWFDKADHAKGRPFSAKLLGQSPQDGAGAIPLISQFLAWSRAERIDGIVRETLDELRLRAPGGVEFLVKAYIVAGLAGGTGRGSWTSLAFALNAQLAAQGHRVLPTAFLFDQSVMQSIKGSLKPAVVLKQQTNSLTGISELVMWMRNEIRPVAGESMDFTLPNLKRPLDREHAAFCSTVITGGKAEIGGRSPCVNAWLVFGSNANGVLSKPEDYYDMVGGALYARLARHEIDSREINEKIPSRFLGSIGCNRIEIPATRIRGALGRIAQYEWLADLVRGSRPQAMEIALDQFRQAAQLNLNAFRRMEPGLERQSNKPLHQRIWSEVAGRALIGPLQTALTDDDRDQAIAKAEQLKGGLDRKAVAAALDTAFGDPVSAFAKAISQHLSDKPDSLDIAGACDLLDEVHADLEIALKSVASGAISPLHSDGEAIPQPDQAVRDAASKRFLLWGRRFDEEEQKSILDVARKYTKYQSFQAVREELVRRYQAAIARIGDLRSRLGAVRQAVVKRRDDLEKDVFAAAPAIARARGSKQAISPASMVFADPARPETILQSDAKEGVRIFDALRNVRTILRPALCENELRQLCRERIFDEEFHSHTADFFEWLRGESVLGASGERPLNERDRGRLRTQAREHLDGGLYRMHVPDKLLEDRFAFRQVVAGNARHFIDQINDMRSKRSERRHLIDAFEAIYNTKVVLDDEDFARDVDENDLLRGLAIALAARCDPYATVERSGGAVRADSATVLLPACDEFGDGFQDAVRDDPRLKQTNIPRDHLVVRPVKASHGNPFVMLAYVSNSYDIATRADQDSVESQRLASIDYWKSSTRLRTELELCERSDGSSVFSTDRDTTGLGYLNPTFVREEAWASLRWRPWYDSSRARQADELTRHRVEDAILYMLAASLGDVEHPRATALLESVRSGDDAHEALPALLDQQGRHYSFTRRPRVRKRSRTVDGDALADRDLNQRDGLIKFHRRIVGSEALVDEIEKERAIFDDLCDGYGLTKPLVKAIRDALYGRLDALLRDANKQGGEERVERIQILTMLRDRAQEFRIGTKA